MPRAVDAERSAASMRGRIGAFALHAQHDSREITGAARAAFLSKFELQVDPDRKLTPGERARRAAAARSLHFARLALASVKARRKADSKRRKKRPTAPYGEPCLKKREGDEHPPRSPAPRPTSQPRKAMS